MPWQRHRKLWLDGISDGGSIPPGSTVNNQGVGSTAWMTC